MNKRILIGGGGHAKVVLDCLNANHENIVGIFDPRMEGLLGIPSLGDYREDIEPDAEVIIAIGDNTIRKRIAMDTKHGFANSIHPSVLLSPKVVLGIGCMIFHRAIIQSGSKIGNHVIVNTGAQIDHDCVVEDFSHVAPGSVLCGSVTVHEGALIGAGSTVIPCKSIGKWAVIGAGSVVISDIPDFAIAVGNPAKILKYRYE
jgi:sugar O-acyltransferase (sialic acid O-acetyltransferase NeuD family)